MPRPVATVRAVITLDPEPKHITVNVIVDCGKEAFTYPLEHDAEGEFDGDALWDSMTRTGPYFQAAVFRKDIDATLDVIAETVSIGKLSGWTLAPRS